MKELGERYMQSQPAELRIEQEPDTDQPSQHQQRAEPERKTRYEAINRGKPGQQETDEGQGHGEQPEPERRISHLAPP